MVTAILIVAPITLLVMTVLICTAITIRPATPCLFDMTIVYTKEGRYDGGKCSGKPENLYLSNGVATEKLDGTRVCNGHVKYLQDVADQLDREWLL